MSKWLTLEGFKIVFEGVINIFLSEKHRQLLIEAESLSLSKTFEGLLQVVASAGRLHPKRVRFSPSQHATGQRNFKKFWYFERSQKQTVN